MEPFGFSSTFGFTINLDFWFWLFEQPQTLLTMYLFAIIGWVILFLIFFYMCSILWVIYRTKKGIKNWQWMVLAVDIPPLYIQTPKAVEQIFAHLSGAKITPNIGQKYWIGKKQKYFSFEIISIEGYIQFLVRTEAEFRDLVEAAVYAQYPEAEITEVEDYVEMIPKRFPNETHEMFGVEFTLAQHEAYPIRTYQEFEYNISKDLVFSDPMAAILENFSRIGHGENFWFQIIVEPTGNSWKEKGIELVKTIITGKKSNKASFVNKIGDFPMMLAKEFFKILNPPSEDSYGSVIKETPPGKVSDLSPGMKSVVESIEEKIARIGFKTKMRALYAARKEVFNPAKCMDGFVGALNQFHIMSRNGIVPYKVTTAHYAFAKERTITMKNKFYQAFAKRKIKVGATPYVLNIEELATIWHFPLPFVKTPLIQKAGAKRGEPPTNLPIELDAGPLRPKTKAVESVPPSEPEVAVVPEPEEQLYG